MARLLLIEDDDSQRFVAAFALRKAGHEVQEAQDGPAGLAAVQAHDPEVIVCDVMMPGMTGYEVVAALRADPLTASIPIILLTAMSDRQHMRQGMTSGADDYLTKPYKPAELIEAVNAALAKRQSQEQAYMSSVSEALEVQKEDLGRRYEEQLVREVNARWARSAKESGDIDYPKAVLLQVDLLGTARTAAGDTLAAIAKQAQQSARDTLYLFGASHVLPYGDDLLAIFAGDGASITTPVELRALRAAFALLKSTPRERGSHLSLHCGPLTLIAVHDGLHGDMGHTPVPGETTAATAALRETAQANGWRIAASRVMADALTEHSQIGRAAQSPRGDEALEIRPLQAG